MKRKKSAKPDGIDQATANGLLFDVLLGLGKRVPDCLGTPVTLVTFLGATFATSGNPWFDSWSGIYQVNDEAVGLKHPVLMMAQGAIYRSTGWFTEPLGDQVGTAIDVQLVMS